MSRPVYTEYKALVFDRTCLQQGMPVGNPAGRPVGNNNDQFRLAGNCLENLRETQIIADKAGYADVGQRQDAEFISGNVMFGFFAEGEWMQLRILLQDHAVPDINQPVRIAVSMGSDISVNDADGQTA